MSDSGSHLLEIFLSHTEYPFIDEAWLRLNMNKNCLNHDQIFIVREESTFTVTLFFSKNKHKYKAMSFLSEFFKQRNIRYKYHVPKADEQREMMVPRNSVNDLIDNFDLIDLDRFVKADDEKKV